MILKTNDLCRLEITFFNSILSARLISVLDFILRSPDVGDSDFNRGQTELLAPSFDLSVSQKRRVVARASSNVRRSDGRTVAIRKNE